jgi:hypothetical protein
MVFMATKAAVPPTAAVSNETADAANAGMPKAHQPKQTHEQAREEPAHNHAREEPAHNHAGTAQAQHETTQQHRTTAQQKRTAHMTAPHDGTTETHVSTARQHTHNSTNSTSTYFHAPRFRSPTPSLWARYLLHTGMQMKSACDIDIFICLISRLCRTEMGGL